MSLSNDPGKSLAALPWGIPETAIAAFYALAMAGNGVALMLRPQGATIPTMRQLLPGILLGPLGVVLLLASMRSAMFHVSPKAFLGRTDRPGRLLLKGLVAGLVIFAVVAGLSALAELVAKAMGREIPLQDAVLWLGSSDLSGTVRTVLLLQAALFAPFAEEMLFRGILLSAFERAGRGTIGVLVTSVFFALCHGSTVALLPTAAVGLVSAWFARRTGSLLPSLALHVAFNVANLFLIFLLFLPT